VLPSLQVWKGSTKLGCGYNRGCVITDGTGFCTQANPCYGMYVCRVSCGLTGLPRTGSAPGAQQSCLSAPRHACRPAAVKTLDRPGHAPPPPLRLTLLPPARVLAVLASGQRGRRERQGVP
jgi:hypothetical protein